MIKTKELIHEWLDNNYSDVHERVVSDDITTDNDVVVNQVIVDKLSKMFGCSIDVILECVNEHEHTTD